MTLNVSGSNPISITELESFLKATPGSLSPTNSLFGAIEGSLISQKFSANSDDILSFNWSFLTNDSAAEILPGFLDADYAFVALAGPDSLQLNVLSTSGSTLLIPSSDPSNRFEKSTSLSNYSLRLPSTNSYTLSLGIVDVGGSANTSALRIDDVKLERTEPVPEPLTVGGTIAAGVLGFLMKRRITIIKTKAKATVD